MKRGILIVDDDVDFLMSLQLIAKSNGIEISTARSGVEALLLLQSGSFRMLVTDFIMAEMDGITLARHAKSLLPSVEIILMTGTNIPDLREIAHNAGIGRILFKPFSGETLLELL